MQLKNIILINVILTIIEIKEIKLFKCGSKYLNITPGILDTENKSRKRRIEGEEEGEKYEKLIMIIIFLINLKKLMMILKIQ